MTFARAQSLVDLLRESHSRFADRPAIVFRDRALTYGELWRRASALASALRLRGVAPGDRVALLIENSPDYVAAYYAALMAGGIAVGLNTAARAGELARHIRHCGADVLIASPDHPEFGALAESNCVSRIVLTAPPKAPLAQRMDTMDEFIAQSSGEQGAVTLTLDMPAAIIYTSGTTGDAKGVTLSHGNLLSNALAIVQYLQLTDRDSIVNVLPFFYSYGNSVLHTHLAVGATIHLENSLTYPHLVVEKIAKERVTGFAGVPSTFALLLKRVQLRDYDLSALRYVTQAGGAMSPELTTQLRSALPHAEVFVMYGQTEATARLTYLPPRRLDDKLGSVGIPVPGVEIQVRAESGEVAGAGVEGEVWARGPNVMLGYWRDPEGTAQTVRDGWLKTGDVGRIDAEGFLYLCGRRSDMIKSGAHRIHPKDIEDVIATLAGVAEVAVIGVDDELLGQAIKAVVVPVSGTDLTAMQVQAHCKRHLPNHKIPKIVVMASSLPKTASGKVQRAMLQKTA